VPADVPSGRLATPAVEAQPSGTDVPQLESESVAFGVAYGENDPVTFPPVTVKLVIPGAPTTEKAGSCFHRVGAPGGVIHVSLNFDVEVGTRDRPLKTLEHLLDFAPVKVKVPLMAPSTTKPAFVKQGLAELPKLALTTIVSVVDVPLLKSGGVNLIVPDHTPWDWLQVTTPGSTGWNFVAAPAPSVGTSARTNTPATPAIMRRESFFICHPPSESAA
jgi:hypothetical protein